MVSNRHTCGVESGSTILLRVSLEWYHQALRCSQRCQKTHLGPPPPGHPLYYLSLSPSPSIAIVVRHADNSQRRQCRLLPHPPSELQSIATSTLALPHHRGLPPPSSLLMPPPPGQLSSPPSDDEDCGSVERRRSPASGKFERRR